MYNQIYSLNYIFFITLPGLNLLDLFVSENNISKLTSTHFLLKAIYTCICHILMVHIYLRNIVFAINTQNFSDC